MLDRTMLYHILYALAARDGREKALFGTCASQAFEAFERSLACEAFPELWFELPLLGEPWFDLHALTSREDVRPGMAFQAETTGGNPDAFAWFAAQERGVRQLALSWDVSTGDPEHPAIQLLASESNPEITCGFLDAAGRPDAKDAYRTFRKRIPAGWFACYAGVFPHRSDHTLRVECIPSLALQRAYAADAALLETHLRHVGLAELGESVIPRCQLLASMPFRLEFQFDIEPDGAAGPTFGASARFAGPSDTETFEPYDPNGVAGRLMEQVEAWGLADDRWRLLADCMYANRVSFDGQSALLFCLMTFLKLRWRAGTPVDAKVYLRAGMQ